MFAIKTSETRSVKLHILTGQIGVHTLGWGACDKITIPVLMALYRGYAVELKIVNGEDATDTLNRLVLDRANEFVEVLQDAFASASFDLLLSTVVVNEADYEVPADTDETGYEPMPEWLGALLEKVDAALKAIDNKYYPLIVAELCNPTVTKPVGRNADIDGDELSSTPKRKATFSRSTSVKKTTKK